MEEKITITMLGTVAIVAIVAIFLAFNAQQVPSATPSGYMVLGVPEGRTLALDTTIESAVTDIIESGVSPEKTVKMFNNPNVDLKYVMNGMIKANVPLGDIVKAMKANEISDLRIVKAMKALGITDEQITDAYNSIGAKINLEEIEQELGGGNTQSVLGGGNTQSTTLGGGNTQVVN